MPQEQKSTDARTSVFVDAHVHIHDCFDVDRFLDAAAANFRGHAAGMDASGRRFVLCLTETRIADKFRMLAERAVSEPPELGRAGGSWYFLPGADNCCVMARHRDHGDIELVAGRQIVTAEKLEVLALGSLDVWEDGMPARAVIESVIEAGAVPVLPWGFGKWLGRRRRVIESLIEKFDDGSVYLGDNGGRSAILPTPPEFALAGERGIRILPGSDPLPFDSEYNRAGSYGFQVDDLPLRDGIWAELCAMLQRGDGKLRPFGALESPFRFARNQLAMQYVTRIASRKRAA
jgi:hypothetical protein